MSVETARGRWSETCPGEGACALIWLGEEVEEGVRFGSALEEEPTELADGLDVDVGERVR